MVQDCVLCATTKVVQIWWSTHHARLLNCLPSVSAHHLSQERNKMLWHGSVSFVKCEDWGGRRIINDMIQLSLISVNACEDKRSLSKQPKHLTKENGHPMCGLLWKCAPQEPHSPPSWHEEQGCLWCVKFLKIRFFCHFHFHDSTWTRWMQEPCWQPPWLLNQWPQTRPD